MFSDNQVYIDDVRQVAVRPLPWEKLNGRTVLITGASGMIGTFLIDVLMERNINYAAGIKIFALGRSKDRALARFRDYINDYYFTFIQCDLNEEISLEGEFDYIFHCASNTHPTAYATDPIGTIMTNVWGTNQILRLAAKCGSKRVLFMSTVEIYGENRGDVELFDEEYCGYIDCNTLRAGYPEGKRTGEALCQAYIRSYDLDIVIPRICRVFGPTMLSSDSKALSQFIKKAVAKEDIILKSDGNQYFSYCYVGDAVSALLYLLFYGEKGQAYNIADVKFNIRLKELARMLAETAGTQVVFQLPDSVEASGYSKATIALLNAEKLQKLGWAVQGGIRERLEKTVCVLRSL
ncbi:NAD-dependent epimerase/dehydratase family protein [Clostridium sp. AF18-27]|uniref:NAD-dependent epimerase/dehydratase family protein n=1 Tax=Enterocloster lavalensis TaxID=460384 RepID=UPI000E549FCC|nr:NAD-dependent epimerase/dehydratase family protein [Enterocloster lavalensis]RHR51903.1 NAD-dependent epimerase/dehydratase family protein [Clostridium sp. AF18-27]